MTTYVQSAAQARAADSCAIQEYGIPSLVLMEHAAQACAQAIRDRAQPEDNILFLSGPGNNGADALAAARLLHLQGYTCQAAVPSQGLSPDEQIQLDICRKLGIELLSLEEAEKACAQADWIVDGLFGSGLSREIRGIYASLIQAANASGAPVLSIDIPSGIDGTTGDIKGCAIQADTTVSLDGLKTGQLLGAGRKACGTLIPADITIPAEIHEKARAARLLDETELKKMLPPRPEDANKSTFGKGLIIGGSRRMHGALCMAADACYHSGIGTLTLLLPECIADVVAGKLNQAMLLPAPEQDGMFGPGSTEILEEFLPGCSVVLIGNGMRQNEEGMKMLEMVLRSDKPVILDADAINLAASRPELLARSSPLILTPHVKEFSRLSGIPVSEIVKDPFAAARAFTEKFPQAVLLLKSDMSLISSSSQTYVLNSPNPALAKGGSGDILAGITLGLLGQCDNPLQAAACAAGIHSLAARDGQDSACFQPEDLIWNLNTIFTALR